MEFLARTEAAIADWHGIEPPNAQAHRFAGDLADSIAAFAAIRGGLAFENEPADFDAALNDTAVP
jgi:hypothetical protein